MISSTFFFVLAIVFLVTVVPLWIVFHYITRWKQMKTPSPANGQVAVDKAALAELRNSAETLEDRIRNLEKLLDGEAPGWREK